MKVFSSTSDSKPSSFSDYKIIGQNSGFLVVEAYKTIRTNLRFALPKTGCKKIIITSAMPQEGKSCNAVNLAITLSLTNARVLLIDCDMRKAALQKILKLDGNPGLSEVLAGMSRLNNAIREKESPSYNVICAGTIPPNPAELLGSNAMAEIIESLESEFDYILMDTPPLNIVSDALALSRISDGIILIVREGKTTHTELKRAIGNLEFAGAKLIGLILSDVEKKNNKIYEEYKK